MLALILLVGSCDALRLNGNGMDSSADKLITVPYEGPGQYDSQAYMPAVGAFQDKFFSTIDLNEQIWNLAPGMGFNPSITLLPEEVRNALNISDAKFVASVRHWYGQCKNLGTMTTKLRRAPQRAKLPVRTSMYLLNDLFQPVKSVRIDFAIGYDARLLSHNGKLIISYMTYSRYAKPWSGWHLHSLELGIDKSSGKVFAAKSSLANAMPSFKTEEYRYGNGRNIGLLHHKDQPYLLYWAGPANIESEVVLAKEQPEDAHQYHLSANPIHIEEKGVYIVMIHTHGPSRQHGAEFGSEYMQYFLLIDDQPPFAPKRLSEPFCVPSHAPGHNRQCEIIQFLGSVIRDPHDPMTLIISYGINDCEAALTRLPLDVVFRSTESTNKDTSLFKFRHMKI